MAIFNSLYRDKNVKIMGLLILFCICDGYLNTHWLDKTSNFMISQKA